MKNIITIFVFFLIIPLTRAQDIIFQNSGTCNVYYTVFARDNSVNPPYSDCNFYQADQVFSVLPGLSRIFSDFNYTYLMGQNWYVRYPFYHQLNEFEIPDYNTLYFDSFKFFFNPNPCNFYNSVGPCTPNSAGVGIACTACSSTSGTTHLYASYSPFGLDAYVNIYNL